MFLKFFGKKGQEKTEESNPEFVCDIDPDLNYCPGCEVEYRSDINTCPSCNVQLISGVEKIEQLQIQNSSQNLRSMELLPGDELVSLRKGPLKDMKMLQKVLGVERIPSILAGDEASCGKGCCGPEMYLQIKTADIDVATEVLARDFVKSTALNIIDLKHADVVFDEQAKETVCPACGCRFSPTVGACPDCGLCFS
jgi:hypothetical protein